uniref:Uncharacterized protein n=1 Tax=Opuntia streptacantha TaxID=393608 RepID=A0A7C9DTT9_OPUST
MDKWTTFTPSTLLVDSFSLHLPFRTDFELPTLCLIQKSPQITQNMTMSLLPTEFLALLPLMLATSMPHHASGLKSMHFSLYQHKTINQTGYVSGWSSRTTRQPNHNPI